MVSINISNSLLEHHYISIPANTVISKKSSLILSSLCKEMNLDIVNVTEPNKILLSIKRFMKIRSSRNKQRNQDDNEAWRKSVCFVLSTKSEAVGDDPDREQETHAGGRPKKRLR